eukprot:TRINITY_DN10199_c0_g1_i1.p1 TRINITY_DN10199_c0_g1~~TRINITY_DN10199_c0_g1_i1.p1  ORF type:complete len:245 (+),score=30.33 TRINITY_DN10199_c0_g1_i1:41-775(+)
MPCCRLASGIVVSADPPVNDEKTVADLRARVAESIGRTCEEISLFLRGEELQDSAIIEDIDREAGGEDVFVFVHHLEISLSQDWSAYLDNYFIMPGHCIAVGLAFRHSGVLFAAAPGDAGLERLYHDTHEESLLQNDGSFKRFCINEPSVLRDVIDDRDPRGGVWLGGVKYGIIRRDDNHDGLVVLVGARKREHDDTTQGVCLVCCKNYIGLGIFNIVCGISNASHGACRIALTSLFEDYLLNV